MKTFILKIEQDQDPMNPRTEFDNCGKMVCFHKRYTLGDKHDLNADDFDDWGEMAEHLKTEYQAAVILPLYLYDHGGISMSTGSFSCPWDSGQVGFIYMDRETILREAPGNPKILTKKAKQWATKYLEAEVEYYDHYLTGEVYGFIVEDEDGEQLDSCWGFFGYDYCKVEGKQSLDYYIGQAKIDAKKELHETNKEALTLIRQFKLEQSKKILKRSYCEEVKQKISNLWEARRDALETIYQLEGEVS